MSYRSKIFTTEGKGIPIHAMKAWWGRSGIVSFKLDT